MILTLSILFMIWGTIFSGTDEKSDKENAEEKKVVSEIKETVKTVINKTKEVIKDSKEALQDKETVKQAPNSDRPFCLDGKLCIHLNGKVVYLSQIDDWGDLQPILCE